MPRPVLLSPLPLAGLVALAALGGCLDTGKSDDTAADTGATDASDGSDGGSGGTGDAWADEYVTVHNQVRDTVGTAPLSWSAALAESAQVWADALAAENCAFYHDPGNNSEGENLYWASWEATPTEVTEAWASEVVDYDYATNSCNPGKMCGHYTQIVWDDTARVGCAKAACSNGSVVQVCRYDPPGNWVGELPY